MLTMVLRALFIDEFIDGLSDSSSKAGPCIRDHPEIHSQHLMQQLAECTCTQHVDWSDGLETSHSDYTLSK